jgi:excisionase family DNA binding protein
MNNRVSVNVVEAAEAAGVGTTAVRAEIAAGRLVARRMGKRVLIAVDDLRRWIDDLPRVAA